MFTILATGCHYLSVRFTYLNMAEEQSDGVEQILAKVSKQLASVNRLHEKNKIRNEEIERRLTEWEEQKNRLQMNVDVAKTIKDQFKKYVESKWLTTDKENILKENAPEQLEQNDKKTIEMKFPRLNKPEERPTDLQYTYQGIISYPENNSEILPVKTDVKEESKAYNKLIESSKQTTTGNEMSDDEFDVENQMTAFVSGSKETNLITKDDNESSSDESSASHKEIKSESTSILQNRTKLAALHLGLDSDSDDVVDEVTKKTNSDKDDDSFFD